MLCFGLGRQARGLVECLCCLVVIGPIMIIVGIIFLAAAPNGARDHAIDEFNTSVDYWTSTARAQFEAEMGSGATVAATSLALPLQIITIKPDTSTDRILDTDQSSLHGYRTLKYSTMASGSYLEFPAMHNAELDEAGGDVAYNLDIDAVDNDGGEIASVSFDRLYRHDTWDSSDCNSKGGWKTSSGSCAYAYQAKEICISIGKASGRRRTEAAREMNKKKKKKTAGDYSNGSEVIKGTAAQVHSSSSGDVDGLGGVFGAGAGTHGGHKVIHTSASSAVLLSSSSEWGVSGSGGCKYTSGISGDGRHFTVATYALVRAPRTSSTSSRGIPVDAFPSSRVGVTVRSADDPWIEAQRLTQGTLRFGLTGAQKAVAGIVLLVLGCLFTLPTVVIIQCLRRRNRRSSVMYVNNYPPQQVQQHGMHPGSGANFVPLNPQYVPPQQPQPFYAPQQQQQQQQQMQPQYAPPPQQQGYYAPQGSAPPGGYA